MEDAIDSLFCGDDDLQNMIIPSGWFGRSHGKLGRALAQNSTLLHLFVRGNLLDEAGAEELATAMMQNTRLAMLAVETNRLGAQLLAKSLFEKSALTQLNFRHSQIDDDADFCSLLADGLAANQTLQELDLSHTAIGDKAAHALADALRQNAALRTLTLSNNRITDVGALALAETLNSGSRLSHLYLRGNFITDTGASSLFNALQVNECLQELNLFENRLGNLAFRAMANMLLHNTRLQFLCLHVAQFDCCETAADLANALTQNTTLRSLRMVGAHSYTGNKNISSAALEIFSQALAHNRGLEFLQLLFGLFGDAMAQRVLHGLERNETLRYLDLNSNFIGDQSIRSIAHALARNQSLQTLNLSFNNFGNVACEALARALQRNGCLQSCFVHSQSLVSNTGTLAMRTIDKFCDRNKEHCRRKIAHARATNAVYRMALAMRRVSDKRGNDCLTNALQSVHVPGQMIMRRCVQK